jgi:hypothetical protein
LTAYRRFELGVRNVVVGYPYFEGFHTTKF